MCPSLYVLVHCGAKKIYLEYEQTYQKTCKHAEGNALCKAYSLHATAQVRSLTTATRAPDATVWSSLLRTFFRSTQSTTSVREQCSTQTLAPLKPYIDRRRRIALEREKDEGGIQVVDIIDSFTCRGGHYTWRRRVWLKVEQVGF